MQYPKYLRSSGALLAAALSAGVSAAEIRYRVELFVTQEGVQGIYGNLIDLNDRGEVIGEDWHRSSGETSFVWSAGNFQSLRVEGEPLKPERINDRGQIAGRNHRGTYIYDHGRAVNINPASDPSRSWMIAGFNNARQAVGNYVSERELEQYFHDGHTTRAMGIWQQAGVAPQYVDIHDLNDHGVVLVSYYDRTSNKQATFTWQDGVTTPLALPPVEGEVRATRLNNAGHVAGSVRTGESGTRPVLFRDGTAVDLLGTAPGQGAVFNLNDKDWMVGTMRAAPEGAFSAFLYRDSQMFDVNDLLVARDARRWNLSEAYQINERGQFLAGGTARGDGQLFVRALLTPVPEPQSKALLLVGLGFVAAVARRTRAPAARP